MIFYHASIAVESIKKETDLIRNNTVWKNEVYFLNFDHGNIKILDKNPIGFHHQGL